MTRNIEAFIKLIDQALEISEKTLQDKQIQQSNLENTERLHNVINALKSIRSKALNGQLEPSGGISTLGLVREVADWIEPLDSQLLKAVGAIEKYYQTNL
ncbi:hypothetical protein [Nostoc sp. TCL26-01]|uniref:hypothetical protein n=1 Tax=Nostoc sp. TCL26-01 TaxID=2576904 RepID=UPI0015B8C6A0|nr:hypothetical protein [Nostoc sp. TCL26-01]QLE54592.1 hypothetical protein FD725_03130 [Nostoc sp. TCL26-01]